MIISTAAQWAAVSLSASGVLIAVDGEVEEEWRSCSKSPLLGASVTESGFTGGFFKFPSLAGKPKVTTVFVPGSCHKPPFTPHTLRTLVRDNTEQS